jgi:hypothetical protein
MSALELCSEPIVERYADMARTLKRTCGREWCWSAAARKHLSADKWNIVDLTVPGWKVSASDMAEMVRDLSEIMTEGTEGTTILVFHLLDNYIYQVKNVGGASHLQLKGMDNMYDVKGRLSVATKENVKELFSAVMPVVMVDEGELQENPTGSPE